MQSLRIKVYGKRIFRDKEALELIRKAATATWEDAGIDLPAQLEVTLTDDAGIREINRDTREIDAPTDVLSFPMQDFYHGECEFMEYSLDPESGRLPLGDMVLSVERARAQGEEFGHGFRRECAYLTVHSCLHLLGYDHLDEGPEKKLMREKEEIIMDRLGLRREMTLEESK